MTDFTVKTYKILVSALVKEGYAFQTFSEFILSPAEKVIVLRHDVDNRNKNSLRFAEIQHQMGIHGSYYFRIVPQSFNIEVIKKIAGLGHEIGYHYETMDSANSKGKRQKAKGITENLIDEAYEEFCNNLEIFRKIVPIQTICMHGSPRSGFDNKEIWKKYDYHNLGLLGEPYFDIDFNEVAYLTDTGRRWNGNNVSIRDKVESPFDFNFRSTKAFINNVHLLPGKVMLTFHPQRWHDNTFHWIKEYIFQNAKNQVKYWLLKLR
jgi:hypothetical protein